MMPAMSARAFGRQRDEHVRSETRWCPRCGKETEHREHRAGTGRNGAPQTQWRCVDCHAARAALDRQRRREQAIAAAAARSQARPPFGPYGPLAADHPAVGRPCGACGAVVASGDVVGLRPMEGQSRAERNVEAELVHWTCPDE
jgi:endogenous inhibitor of DNA gyrase (YacG/DUF329 family)